MGVKTQKRPIREPGGALLIGLGLSDDALHAAIQTLYPQVSSLTVLADGDNHQAAQQADELWVYAPLGLRGFMALIRRISWRHFDAVYQPQAQPRWLKYMVWPRPLWRHAVSEA
jgi:hypothetical protein